MRYTSADPRAALYLDDPNQFDSLVTLRSLNGNFDQVYDRPMPPVYLQDLQCAGLFRVAFVGPRAFDKCTTRSGPVGQVCAADWHIWVTAPP